MKKGFIYPSVTFNLRQFGGTNLIDNKYHSTYSKKIKRKLLSIYYLQIKGVFL